MTDTFNAKALKGFTLHTPKGFLIFNAGKVTKNIGEDYRQRLETHGVIPKADAGDDGAAVTPAPPPVDNKAELTQLDHDSNGKPGGDLAADVIAAEQDGLTLTDAGGGWWHITGPDLVDPVKVRGEDAARERFAELTGIPTAPAD